MKKEIYLLLLLFTFTFPTFGQNTPAAIKPNPNTTYLSVKKVQPVFDSIDILILKDGSKIKCKIISETADRLTISLLGSTETSIPKGLIEEIKPGNKNHYYFSKGAIARKSGFYLSIDRSEFLRSYFSSNENGNSNSNFDISRHISFGIMLNSKIAVGVGTGYEFYQTPINTYSFNPIYAEIRGCNPRKKVSPYYSLAVGVGLPNNRASFITERDAYYKPGLFLKPAVGYRFATRWKFNFLFEVGYRIQTTQSHYKIWTRDLIRGFHWKAIDSDITFRRFHYTIGLLF